ncbi:MAG: hypothetical protein KJ042_15410, partial [Deltaproteobacteria bacterium]|nr:hypothetical protein [Deltaproteobacteria bacterium]
MMQIMFRNLTHQNATVNQSLSQLRRAKCDVLTDEYLSISQKSDCRAPTSSKRRDVRVIGPALARPLRRMVTKTVTGEPMSDFRTMLIVNPNSANGATKRNWREIDTAVRRHLRDFDHRMTTRPGDATMLAIVSVGGDGTNTEIVNGFFENDRVINPDAVFATIPQGTGGDFRRTIGVPRDFREAAAFLPGRDAKRIDVGRMTLV